MCKATGLVWVAVALNVQIADVDHVPTVSEVSALAGLLGGADWAPNKRATGYNLDHLKRSHIHG